ncbi:MAG: HAD family hydrolase, partial [Chloroherpetonaceae bacterium]|nr:HAD family hydrolase [Chloroherpetonaceae bacterium]
ILPNTMLRATPFNPKDVRAILFDLGGTLLHLSYPFFYEQFQERYQYALSEMRFFQAVSCATEAMSQLVQQHQQTTDASRLPIFFETLLTALDLPFELSPDRSTFVQEVILAEHQRSNLWRYLLPDTEAVLKALQPTYRLAMISNSDGRAEALTITHGLRPYLEFVLDSHYVGVEKPDAKIFLLAAEKLGLSPSECVYVGDIYAIDVLGARAAGMNAILLDRTKKMRTDCLVISTLSELLSFF